jgi:hypothetical protein
MSLGSPLRGSSPAEAAAELAGTSPPVRSIERGRFVQLVVCFSVCFWADSSPSFLLGLDWFCFQPTLLPVSLFFVSFFLDWFHQVDPSIEGKTKLEPSILARSRSTGTKKLFQVENSYPRPSNGLGFGPCYL